MLEHTFLHLPGIGYKLESRLWEAGILTWDEFSQAGSLPGISSSRRDKLVRLLDEGRARLNDLAYWCGRLPAAEHWRLYGHFFDQTAFLDIETSGLSVEQGGEVSLIGLYYAGRYRSFVNGRNLEKFEAALEPIGLLVTFNGACFDLPYLSAYLRHLRLPPGHIDLRYPLRRLGFKGGLKKIEPLFGLARNEAITGIDGWQAVLLWRDYLAGMRRALGVLIRYNRADTVNLKVLMEQTYDRLGAELLGPAWWRAPGRKDRPEAGSDWGQAGY